MEIYYLCQHGARPFRKLSNPTGGSRVVHPEGSSPKAWAKARQRAIQHCASLPGSGTRYCMIVVGHVDVRYVQRRDWAKPGYPLIVRTYEAEDRFDHALITYTERILRQHAAMVLVPPAGAVAQLPPTWAENTPTLPMVAAYRVEAALSVDTASFSPGYELVSKGFRVVTLGDYCYAQHGPTVFDEYGSTSKWGKAYERATEKLLGVRSRH